MHSARNFASFEAETIDLNFEFMGDIQIPCWHLCSGELVNKLIFKTLDDYRFGMNSIPIAMLDTGVTIFCFALMSNHAHFLLGGVRDKVVRFFNLWKSRIGKHLVNTLHRASPFLGLQPTLVQVTSPEMFKIEVAYILRNPLAARICDPYTYYWSTAYLYFNRRIRTRPSMTIDQMNSTQLRQILLTRKSLPGQYKVCDGIILPESYVDIDSVENAFGKPTELFRMVKDWNTEQNAAVMEGAPEKVAYSDDEILDALQEYFRERGVTGFENMKYNDKCKSVAMLRNRFGSGMKQICRLTYLDRNVVCRYGGFDLAQQV